MEKSPQELLVYWIRERDSIRQLRLEGQPKPWSDNPVFQVTYFCNVRREDDTVTKWIRQNWSPEKIGWDDYEYAMVIARMLNWPPTLALFGNHGKYDLRPETIQRALETGASYGEKVWGNAYVVTTHGISMPKAQYLCERVLPAAYAALGAGRWRKWYGYSATLAQRHKELMELEGLASFMAAQVIADLKNTVGHPLYAATDWSHWSSYGPGSLRGLGWFFGKKISPTEYPIAIEQVYNYVVKQGAEEYLKTDGRFNMQDLQNCLCEYDKYMRVKSGTGRSKRSYPGRS